jgi:hypothetical protein
MTLPPGWAPRAPEHQPGVIPLRPLSIGDLFSGIFATIRGHWRPLLGVSAAAAAVMTIGALLVMLAADPVARAFLALATLDQDATTDEAQVALEAFADSVIDFAPWLILLFALNLVLSAAVEAGTAIVVSKAVLGETAETSEVFSRVLRLLPRLLVLSLLMAVSIGVGLFLCLIPGIVLYFLWFGAPTAVALEDVSPITALRRSATLMGRSFWRVVGILLLIQIVYGVAFQVISTPVSFLTSAGIFGSGTTYSDGAVDLMLFSYLLLMLAGVLTYPFIAVARSLEYLDLRMRQEGLAESLVRASR